MWEIGAKGTERKNNMINYRISNVIKNWKNKKKITNAEIWHRNVIFFLYNSSFVDEIL